MDAGRVREGAGLRLDRRVLRRARSADRTLNSPRRSLAGLLLLLAAAGCTLLIPGREAKVGRVAAEQVERSMGLVEDEALVDYVRKIGERLTAHASRQNIEYRFFVVDKPEPNAFALPGGYIYVSRGLLLLANSEDELAGVIGHEIGHVSARHHLKTQLSTVPFIPLGIAAGLAAFVTGILDPGLGQGIGQLTTLPAALLLSSHGRGQEREADEIGQGLAAAAGWDPAGLSRLLTTLGREEELRGHDPDRVDFLASHPPSPERSRTTLERAAQLVAARADPIAADRGAFLGQLDGMLVGLSGAEGVFEEGRFLHPDLGFSLSFPEGWELHNLPHVVAGRDTEAGAYALMQIVAKGEDPMGAAGNFQASGDVKLIEGPEAVRIGELSAARATARARTADGDVSIDATWISLDGNVYLVAGVAPSKNFDAERSRLRAISESFRAISPAERAEVREERLRVWIAEADESFAALAERSGTRWEARSLAMANGHAESEVPGAGVLIKVPIPEAYFLKDAASQAPTQ